MKQEQITSIVFINGNSKPQSLKFTDWIIETKHYKQMPRELNEVRDIAEHILSGFGYKFVSLNTKTLK